MFEVKSEAHGRVLEAVEDIKSCCEVDDYYEEWSDVAASSIQAFLEDLSAEQLDDTCGAFREYIAEKSNLADGIKDGLRTCLNEMLDYIGDVTEDDDSENEDNYSDYDRKTIYLAEQIRSNIKHIERMNCQF